jgi:hypothetical protein
VFRRLPDPLPPDLGGVDTDGAATCSPDAVLAEQFATWARWWGHVGAAHAHDDARPVLRAIGDTIAVDTLTPDTIRASARSFSATASSVDGLHPRQVSLLSDDALRGLSALFGFFDRSQWPLDEQLVLARLLPKKHGGLRPVALFRAARRVYAKARVWKFRRWADTQARVGLNLQSGRSTLDATWRCRVRDLSRTRSYAAELQMDLKKAFKQVARGRLIDLAIADGCSLHPLLVSLSSCSWPRRLLYGCVVTRPVLPTRGVAAGSSTAAFEFELHLADAVRRVTSILPRPVVSARVGDASVYATGRAPNELLPSFCRAVAACQVEFAQGLDP